MKLKTDVVKMKKTKKKYVRAMILSIIGIILTCVFQMKMLGENNILKNNFKSVVGVSDAKFASIPRLPNGYKAVNNVNGKYEEVKDPYNANNFVKWNNKYYAQNSKNEVIRWIPAFKFRVEYYKGDEFLGSANWANVFDKDGKEMDSKEFEKKLNTATHYKYGMKDISVDDETYMLHPAFEKVYITSGFWVSLTPTEFSKKEETTIDSIYGEMKNKLKEREESKIIDSRLAKENILNPFEYGALKVLGLNELFDDNKNEMLLGVLENSSGTSEMLKDKKSGENKSVLTYPMENIDDPKANFEKAYLNRGLYGDGFTETRGFKNKDTNEQTIDENNFLKKDNEYLGFTKNGNKFEVKALPNKIAADKKIYIRTVINIKPTTTENKITHTFKANGGQIMLKDGQVGDELKYTQNLGALITEEKINQKIPNPTRDGYIFKGWSPDPTGNIFFEDMVFEAQWEKVEVLDKDYGIARFYYTFDNNSKYLDIKTKINEKISEEEIRKVEKKIEQETGSRVLRWAPNPQDIKMSAGIKEFKPVRSVKDEKGWIDENIKEVAFTFYKNANKEEWITVIGRYDIRKKEEQKGIAPSSIKGLDELIKKLDPKDGANYEYKWNRSLDEPRAYDTEYVPIFRTYDPVKPDDGEITVYIDYNGSRFGGQLEKKYKFKKGQKLSDNKELYEEMLSDRHYKPNYELPANKKDWYTPSIDTVINDTITFKLNWQISYITVRFWNAPKDYDKKQIIKEDKIPSGSRVTLPENNKVLPYYETTNPLTGKKVKRSFNQSDGWTPKEVYDVIYANSYGVKKEDGKYVLDIYPIFESEYNDPSEMVTVRYDLNIPRGEETNVFYPDRQIFDEKKVKKGTIIFRPSDSDLPKIPGYVIKGYSPNLPHTVEGDTTIKFIWEKRQLYPVNPVLPSQNDPVAPSPYRPTPSDPNTGIVPILPRNNGKDKDQKQSGWLIDRKNPEKPKDEKTEVNVKAGLKSNKYIIFIGTALTTIIVFSYIKIKNIDELVRRSEENRNIW